MTEPRAAAGRALRVLVVTGVFPPFASVGANRVYRAVKYLLAAGHDVRVITTDDHPLPKDALPDLPADRVVVTRAFNLHRPSEAAQGGRSAVIAAGGRRAGPGWDLLRRVWRLYTALAYVPDYLALWHPFATAAGRRLLSSWPADVIVSSGPPHSAHMIARTLARRFGVPWIAELRDPWVDNVMYPFPGWRRRLDTIIERRTLRDAAALVTVTERFADGLRRKFAVPVEIVGHGFDPDMLPASVGDPVTNSGLRLVHTGTLYPERYDLAGFFAAVRALSDAARRQVKVVLIGRLSGDAMTEARKAGIEALVEAHAPVGHREAMAAQATADVLLLFGFKGEQVTPHAKLYEYLGVRRPILIVGPRDSDAGVLVESLGAGRASDDPATLTRLLADWVADKGRDGSIPPTPAGIAQPFSRDAQLAKLASLVARVAAGPRA